MMEESTTWGDVMDTVLLFLLACAVYWWSNW
jgi:hypothetical protein